MHKQECLDDRPVANRLPIRNVFGGGGGGGGGWRVYDKQPRSFEACYWTLVLTKTGHRVQCRRQKWEEKRDRTAATKTERKSMVGGTSICSNFLILSPPSHLPLSFHAISFLHGVSFSSPVSPALPSLSLATRHSLPLSLSLFFSFFLQRCF